jgi:hypothetical protein
MLRRSSSPVSLRANKPAAISTGREAPDPAPRLEAIDIFDIPPALVPYGRESGAYDRQRPAIPPGWPDWRRVVDDERGRSFTASRTGTSLQRSAELCRAG